MSVGRPPDVPVTFEALTLAKRGHGDPVLVNGAPVRAFIGDNIALQRFVANFPLGKFEIFNNSIFFASLEEFSRLQAKFNVDVAERSSRLVLDSTSRPNSNLEEQPTIVVNKVVFKFSCASVAAMDLPDIKHSFLKAVFGSEKLSPFSDFFNEAALFSQSKEKGSDFFLAIGCTTSQVASDLHALGQSLRESDSTKFDFSGHSVDLKEIFSCKSRFGKGEAVPAERWYQLRFSGVVVARNVDRLNLLVNTKLGGGPLPAIPRVVLGHPVFAPRGPCFFVSLRLEPAKALTILSQVVNCYDSSDFASPLSSCVSGPYNPGLSVGVCLACGFDHPVRACPRLVRQPAVAGAAAALPSSASVASAASAHLRPAGRPKQDVVCLQFANRGKCWFGDTCYYQHSGSPPPRGPLRLGSRLVVSSSSGVSLAPVPATALRLGGGGAGSHPVPALGAGRGGVRGGSAPSAPGGGRGGSLEPSSAPVLAPASLVRIPEAPLQQTPILLPASVSDPGRLGRGDGPSSAAESRSQSRKRERPDPESSASASVESEPCPKKPVPAQAVASNRTISARLCEPTSDSTLGAREVLSASS